MTKREGHKLFKFMVGSVAGSYGFLEGDKDGLDKAKYDLEIQLIALNTFSREFKEGKISIDEFKTRVGDIVCKETDQLVLADQDGEEIPDETKRIAVVDAINCYDEDEVKKFATEFYRVIANARMVVYKQLNPDKDVFVISKAMMPSDLTVFKDGNTTSSSTSTSE